MVCGPVEASPFCNRSAPFSDPYKPRRIHSSRRAIAQDGEVVELPFQLRLLRLQAFQFLEQEFAVAFRGGQFLFCIGDLRFQARDRRVQVGHFFSEIIVASFQVGDFRVAFGDFVPGLFGRGFGFLLGPGEGGRDGFQLVRQAECFRGNGLDVFLQGVIHLFLLVELVLGVHDVIGQRFDPRFGLALLIHGLSVSNQEADSERDAHNHQYYNSSLTFHND